MSGFRKGDAVTYLSNWDSKGTVTVRDLIVHSCGKKQMVLCNEAGEKFLGAFFPPNGDLGLHGRVVRRLSVAEAEALGLEIAAAWIVSEHAHYADRRVRFADAMPAYHRQLDIEEAKIHEPRVLRKEG